MIPKTVRFLLFPLVCLCAVIAGALLFAFFTFLALVATISSIYQGIKEIYE